MKKVILDVLGGDNGAKSTLAGAIMAMKREPSLNLVLVGDEKVINEAFTKHPELKDRIEITHTTVNIEMGEVPTTAIRTKTNSSMVIGMDALRTRDDCMAFVSAGSTGAVLTGSFMKVGRMTGVSRPALSTMLPTLDRRGVLVLDLGANMDCKPVNLVHFALMADVYLKEQGIEKPRIGLLSVGTEDEKGNELTHAAFEILKKMPINFVGNIEARDAFGGNYDAVITDGFAGNVLLKTLEGCGKLFSSELKRAIGGVGGLLGKLLLARRLIKMKKRLSEDAVGGALLLGTKKPVIKAHGNSNPTAICNAILFALNVGNMNLGDKISKVIADNPVEE